VDVPGAAGGAQRADVNLCWKRRGGRGAISGTGWTKGLQSEAAVMTSRTCSSISRHPGTHSTGATGKMSKGKREKTPGK